MVSVYKLAAKWMINIDVDKALLDSMTQLVKSSSDNPSLSLMFKTNDYMLRYNHFTSDVFVDTLFVDNISKIKLQFT